MDGLQVLTWALGQRTTKMTKHGQAKMMRKRRMMMTRTKAAEVAHVRTRLPWRLMGQMSTTGQPSWGRSLMGRRGLPGDGPQHAGQLALEGLSMLLGISLGGA